MSERVFERANQCDGAERVFERANQCDGAERVFERANQCDGAEGSLVHQARAADDLLHRRMVHQ